MEHFLLVAWETIARKKEPRASISEPKVPEHTARPRDFTNSSLHIIASFDEFKFKFDFKSLSLFLKSIYLFIIYFYFMSVLIPCEHHIHAVPAEARGGH